MVDYSRGCLKSLLTYSRQGVADFHTRFFRSPEFCSDKLLFGHSGGNQGGQSDLRSKSGLQTWRAGERAPTWH
jgi:hypothetical protein